MLLTLLNIILPVAGVAALGFAFGKRQARKPDMTFINHANVMVFCPALVFSALLASPIDIVNSWPLIAAGILIIVVPGIMLALVPRPGLARRAFLVSGMFRNTGNVGIPLMILAYGRGQLSDIVILFVLSNVLHFSLGLYLLSRVSSRWMWLRNPNVWAAVLGVMLAPYKQSFPGFVSTLVDMLGDLAIPLMLFSLGVRLSQDRIENLGFALRINILYLFVGALTALLVVWLLPLTPEWSRLIVLSAMLPPAVLNYLLCEQYRADPHLVAGIVLVGNVMALATIPVVLWLTLSLDMFQPSL